MKEAGKVNHAVHAMTSTFVDPCNQRNVKEVVVGDLKGIKKEKDVKERTGTITSLPGI